MSTAAEKLIEQGRSEGRLQGTETGRAEGRIQGRREGGLEAYRSLSRHLIELKFGPQAFEAIAQFDFAQETGTSTVTTLRLPRERSTREDTTIEGIFNSITEDFLEEGRQEGRVEGEQEGRRQGRQEGRMEGFRAFVRVLAELRFGALTAAASERLDSAEESMLEGCIERLLTASHVEQVLP